MTKVMLKEGVYWVGAIDWNVRNFHGYHTPVGTTFNAYLLVDDKIALIDTVKHGFYREMLDQVREIVDPKDIDYIVSNHVEMDHSGSLPMMMKEAKKARIVTMEKFGESGLRETFHADWDAIPVRKGSEISLGKKKLAFIPTPMLHWPDSMATYVPEDNLLFSMDMFGQHIATSARFDDEVGLEMAISEAMTYYANIMMPFGDLILRALDGLSVLQIDILAPSHGVIWRSHVKEITEAYTSWARGDSRSKVVVAYDTMWGSTDKMAKALVKGVADTGVEVKLFNLTFSARSDIVKEVLEAEAILIGSPTLNNGMFPTVADFLCYLKGLRPKRKIGAAFGSHGWAGGAVKQIEEGLGEAGVEVIPSDLTSKFVPGEVFLDKCVEFGRAVAEKIKRKRPGRL